MEIKNIIMLIGTGSLIIFDSSSAYASHYDISTEQLFNMSLEQLMDIKITTASKRPETFKESPASLSIVTRTEIEKFGYTTLTEVIENIHGIYNINNYTGVSGNFGLRGAWNPRGQNANYVILVNGVNQLKDDTRSNPLDKISVPVESIDRVEIIRGPMSVMYGNGAFFGVINIVTNEKHDHTYLVSASYGQNNTKKIVGRVISGKENFQYSVNMSGYDTDGIDQKFSDMTSTENFSKFPDYGVTDPEASTNKKLQQQNKFLNVSAAYKDWQFDLSHNEADSEFFLLLPPVDEGSSRSVDSNTFMIGFNKDLSNLLDINTRLTYNDYKHEDNYDILTPNTFGFETIEYNAYEFEVLLKFKSEQSFEIIGGYNFRKMDNYRDFINVPDVNVNNELVLIDDRDTWSDFVEITYTPISSLKLVAGYRYEVVKSSDLQGFVNTGSPNETTFGGIRDKHINKSPRFAAIYAINKSNITKLIYSEASRLSDDAFNHEIINSTEINYIYSKYNLLSSISLYHNHLRDLLIKQIEIDSNSTAREFDKQSGNINTTGLEVNLNVDITGSLKTEAGFSYQTSEDQNNKDLEVAYSPKYVAQVKLSYEIDKHIFAISGRFIDSMETYYDPAIDNGDGTFGARIGEKAAAYQVFDVNYRANDFFNHMYFDFRITNLLNETIRYPNNPVNSALLDRGTLGAERTMIGTVGWKY